MPTRIVTSTYRYKHPPRKRKAFPMVGPAIVRRGTAKPETPPAPTNDGWKPTIVPAKPKRRRTWVDDSQDSSPEIKALVARTMRPPGTDG